MTKLFLSFFCALITCLPTFAAQPKAFIKMDPGFFSNGPVAVVNGKTFDAQIWSLGGFDIQNEMKDNPIAAEYAHKQEVYANWAGGFFWGGLGAALVYVVVTPTSNVSSGAFWSMVGGGIIVSSIFRKASTAYLFKAINSYNDVPPEQGWKVDLSVVPVASGATMQLNLNF